MKPSLLWTGTLALVVLTGCATNPAPAGPKFIFYPPSPEPPRLQFLASFSDESDLGAQVSKLAMFVTGAQPSRQPIIKPYGLAFAKQDLYICDTVAGAVEILNFDQKTMRVLAPSGLASLKVPVNIAIDADGTRYVADTGRNQVLIYGADDSFRGTIGAKEHWKPTAVAVTSNRVLVSDLENHCIRVYDKAELKPLATIPPDPKVTGPGQLFMPVNLALDAQGRIYVSDMAACQVFVYDADGKYLRAIGARGDLPGQFARPKGVAVDKAGRVYVVDAASDVCQVFDAEGQLLLFFGEPNGSAAPLNLPAAVIVDDQNLAAFQKYAAPNFVLEQLVIISNQYGNRKISVYGLGHPR